MKVRESALELQRFQIEEKARKVADLTDMVRYFEEIAADLNREVTSEERRTGIRDPAHWAYSTFARSAIQRRENLLASARGLRALLEVAQREYQVAHGKLRGPQKEDNDPDHSGTIQEEAAETLSTRRAAEHVGVSEASVGHREWHRGGRSGNRRTSEQAALSKRQMEILTLLAEGKRTAEIAKVLSRSPSTIKVHVSAILRRLNVNSRTQAALLASELLKNHPQQTDT